MCQEGYNCKISLHTKRFTVWIKQIGNKWNSQKLFKSKIANFKRREDAVNTDFTFQPNSKIQFVSAEEPEVSLDEFRKTESGSAQWMKQWVLT